MARPLMLLPAYKVLLYTAFHLHTTVCYWNVSMGNCLMWRGKRLVKQKRITSPSLGLGPTQKEGELSRAFRILSYVHHTY